MLNFDQSKSLQQLEQSDWGEPKFDSQLVEECHRLRRIPLCDFSAENLCRMIGQNISLPFLVPLALETLKANPLQPGDYYAGALLDSVLRVDAAFWKKHPALADEASTVAQRALLMREGVEEDDVCISETQLRRVVEAFHHSASK